MRAFRERRRRVAVLPHSVMAISDRQLVHPPSVHPVSLMLFVNVCPADPAETRKTFANLPYALLRSKPVFLPVVSVIPIRLALAMDAASMGRVTMSASPVQAAMERKLARPLSVLPVRPFPSRQSHGSCLLRLGYCRNGGCASFPGSTLGQACASDANCIGSETYGEVAASCAGTPGIQPTCGGASAFCYTLAGSFTGESPVCASSMSASPSRVD